MQRRALRHSYFVDPLVESPDYSTLFSYFKDIYLKAAFYYKYKKCKSYKSQAFVVQKPTTTYPVNKEITFGLSSANLNEIILVVTLMERSLLRQDIVLGREILGPYLEIYNRKPTTWGRIALSEYPVSHWVCL